MPDTPYFTPAEFKAAYPDDAEVEALDDEVIDAKRVTAEEIIEGLDTEDGTHVAWVERTETFTAPGGSDVIEIPRYFLRSVTGITIDGEEQEVDDLVIDGFGIYGATWPRFPMDVTVTHGAPALPARLKDAAILLTYHRAVKGPIDDRATGRLTPEGSVVTLATPGLRGAVTGIPEVDGAIAQHRKRRIRPTSVYLSQPSGPALGGGVWREGVWP